MNGPRWSIASFLLLGCVAWCASPEPSPLDAELAYAERMLREADVATDGPGVLNFIRAHTLSEDDLDRLQVTVRALGSPEFVERESASRSLVAAGRPALP